MFLFEVLDFAYDERTDTGMALFHAILVYCKINRNIDFDTIS